MTTPTLRQAVGRAIIDRFEQSYREFGVSYDPDTAWEAADDVMAVLAAALLEQPVEVMRHAKVIGSYGFRTEPTGV